ncbi:MAG: SGNH/GDSL hydrolase family protein [Coprococcus sp.]
MEEKKNRKITVIRLVKVIVFFLGFVGIAAIISYMVVPKKSDPESGIAYPSARGFYGEPENTIDIVVLGNSGAYSGFSPMELWHRHGYTSYVASEGNQNLGQSIIIFNELLENHKPKLLIVDVDCFWQTKNEVQRIEYTLKAYLYRYFPMFKYHDRWKTATMDELFAKKDYNYRTSTKGQFFSRDAQPAKKPFVMEETDEIEEVPLSSVVSMNKLLKICEENDIEVLLIDIPTTRSWNYAKHNGVEKYAKEKGLNFIDCSFIEDEKWAIDWEKDSRDGGNHLNSYGARKITVYLGKYLAENYDFADKRNDEAYAQWEADYQEYKEYMQKGRKIIKK